MRVYATFNVPPHDGPVRRPIHVTASSRSPTKVWSDVLVGNRELTSLVDFLPTVAPLRVELLAFRRWSRRQKSLQNKATYADRVY